MTRETKIGLLVGLAFIIVIGILLSDHMTTTTEPPQAQLQGAGDSLRSGLGTPIGVGVGVANVVTPNVTPDQTVLTREELIPHAAPLDPPVTMARGPAVGTDNSGVPSALREAANHFGEDVETPGAGGNSNNTAIALPQPETPVKPTSKQYKAVAGDTLSRLAGRFLGSNTKANRDAIVAANPSLKDNPNRIVVGRTYTVPTTSPTATTAAPVPVAPAAVIPAVSHADNQTVYTYTVESGDSLWSIADNQLGNAAAWAAIKELNKDVLKGGNNVRAGMKLRLPSKPVATAN